MIIIGILSLIQEAKSEISRKRVICPNCKTTLESLENIGTYQCPECKKKFKVKSKEYSLKSDAEFIFPLNKKIRKKKK
jgi:protein-arginine kinase activator protein McsA